MDDSSNNGTSSPTQPRDAMIVVGDTRDSCHMARGHQLGGPNAVIIADIFIDPATEFPILYLADTVTIPTHYHLHALDLGHTRHSPSHIAMREMCNIANHIIRTGSFLVLGPRLQHWISADVLHALVAHFVPAVIAFDSLRRFDRESDSAFDVSDNFEEMSRYAIRICSIACCLVSRVADRSEQLERLQSILEVANVLSSQRAGGVRGEQQVVVWTYSAF